MDSHVVRKEAFGICAGLVSLRLTRPEHVPNPGSLAGTFSVRRKVDRTITQKKNTPCSDRILPNPKANLKLPYSHLSQRPFLRGSK